MYGSVKYMHDFAQFNWNPIVPLYSFVRVESYTSRKKDKIAMCGHAHWCIIDGSRHKSSFSYCISPADTRHKKVDRPVGL